MVIWRFSYLTVIKHTFHQGKLLEIVGRKVSGLLKIAGPPKWQSFIVILVVRLFLMWLFYSQSETLQNRSLI